MMRKTFISPWLLVAFALVANGSLSARAPQANYGVANLLQGSPDVAKKISVAPAVSEKELQTPSRQVKVQAASPAPVVPPRNPVQNFDWKAIREQAFRQIASTANPPPAAPAAVVTQPPSPKIDKPMTAQDRLVSSLNSQPGSTAVKPPSDSPKTDLGVFAQGKLETKKKPALQNFIQHDTTIGRGAAADTTHAVGFSSEE